MGPMVTNNVHTLHLPLTAKIKEKRKVLTRPKEASRGVIPVALGCELVQSAAVELVSSLAPFSHT